MLHNFVTALVITGYWTSFTFIGFSIWMLARYKFAVGSFRSAVLFIADCPMPAQLLLLTGIGWGALMPFVLLGYLVSASIFFIIAVYIGMLVASLSACVAIRSKLRSYLVECWARIRGEPVFSIVIFVAMIALASLVAYKLGGYLADGTDSFVHMAKINEIASGRLTVGDPFFKGVIESRYHVNIFHVLYAIPTRLAGLPIYTVWRQSLIFFAVLAYLSLWAILWFFLPKNWRKGYPTIIVTMSFLLSAAFWRTANYPNEVVLSWIAIYIIGLTRFLKNRNPVLMLLGAFLIAFTHPTYSLAAFGFTILMLAVVLLSKSYTKLQYGRREYIYSTLALGVLIFPVLFSLALPNRMTASTFNYMDTGTLSLHKYGPFKIMTPPVLVDHGPVALLFMATGLIGVVWLVMRSVEKVQKLVIAMLALFYALIAYNPIFIALFSKQLPPWLIQRFGYFDRLSAVTAVLGFFILGDWLLRKFKVDVKHLRAGVIGAAVFALLFFIIQVRAESLLKQNSSQLTLLKSLTELNPVLQKQTVFADSALSYMVPSAITQAHVVWIPETNASPVANMTLRKRCGMALSDSLSQADLRNAGVSRVLIGAWEPSLSQIANAKPYLHQIASNSDYRVYEVNLPKTVHQHGVCAIPDGE